MKPAEFEAQNIVLGKGQPEYMELPALKCDNAEGTVWSCWELDDADIADLIKHRKLWVGQMTFGNLFHPQMLTTMMPLEVSVATHKARQAETAQPKTHTPITEVTPKFDDRFGKAWEYDLSKVERGIEDTTIKVYIVNAPWAHPMWPNYAILVISLADKEGVKPAQIRLPGATHELILFALNPECVPTIDGNIYYLMPANFCGQFIAADDDAAIKRLEDTVEMILGGRLSPDTDYRHMWRNLFSECDHYWIPERLDHDGNPLYKIVDGVPTTYATCSRCDIGKWFTQDEWRAIPASLPPEK